MTRDECDNVEGAAGAGSQDGASEDGTSRDGISQDAVPGMPVSRCKVLESCKGCPWIDMSYPDQLAAKQRKLAELFGCWCEPEPIVGLDEPCGYRNKFMVPFSQSATGTSFFGLYGEYPGVMQDASGDTSSSMSHRLLDADACEAIDPSTKPVLKTLVELMHPEFRVQVSSGSVGGRSPYDGLVRHAVVRGTCNTSQIMVTLVCNEPLFDGQSDFVHQLRARHPEVASVVQNVNTGAACDVFGQGEQVLFGPGFIEDRLCGCDLRLSSRAFYQNNRKLTERLYEMAIAMVELAPGETILDVFCGVGAIGIIAAKRYGCSLLGVERNEVSVNDARANAKAAGLRNARFFCADATEFVMTLDEDIDVVFCDPPRKGMTRELLLALCGIHARSIVYVSCNPTTLRRDLDVLLENGWRLQRLCAVDMFPHSPHIECVALLGNTRERKEDR